MLASEGLHHVALTAKPARVGVRKVINRVGIQVSASKGWNTGVGFQASWLLAKA